nr:MAG TPA: hypothetical protein [Crassvirales sp.]
MYAHVYVRTLYTRAYISNVRVRTNKYQLLYEI